MKEYLERLLKDEIAPTQSTTLRMIYKGKGKDLKLDNMQIKNAPVKD